ncbi:MAG: DNA-binding NarL/FixJ family response regulator [Granulosicoccus sp.]|jgi:DNA-binding NarL/FixJ family response regulator
MILAGGVYLPQKMVQLSEQSNLAKRELTPRQTEALKMIAAG